MRIKKLWIYCTALLLCLSMTACGQKQETTEPEIADAPETAPEIIDAAPDETAEPETFDSAPETMPE